MLALAYQLPKRFVVSFWVFPSYFIADLIALRLSCMALTPFKTSDRLHRTEPTFNEFELPPIKGRLHWFMGNYAAHRLLDTDRLVKLSALNVWF